jgi:uncharacterized membrane protein YbhN (UPF0104 family)
LVAVPALSHLPAQLVAGCPRWVGLAVLLELVSVVGFIAAFALVFGRGLSGRRLFVAGLRALGSSTMLPGGALVGPAVAVRSVASDGDPPTSLAPRSIAFAVVTAGPSLVTLAVLGTSLWLGWPAGPHSAALTLPAAAVGWVALAGVFLLGRSSAPVGESRRAAPRRGWRRPATASARIAREGSAQARRLLLARDWKLLGAIAYYAFDNAVLWAAFRAFGSAPPVGVIVMGYLVGSLASALPVPAGLGAAEGGLIGALVLYGAPVAPAAAAVLLYRGIALGLAVALGGCGWVSGWSLDPPRRRRHRRATSRPSIIPHRIVSGAPARPLHRLGMPANDAAAQTVPLPLEVHGRSPAPRRV